eukprot:1142074-Pelagomonas_calceolata.AAC.9
MNQPIDLTLRIPNLEKAKSGLAEAGMDDFVLGGNYVCGVALGKVVDHGYELAQAVANRAASRSSNGDGSNKGSTSQQPAAAASSA